MCAFLEQAKLVLGEGLQNSGCLWGEGGWGLTEKFPRCVSGLMQMFCFDWSSAYTEYTFTKRYPSERHCVHILW